MILLTKNKIERHYNEKVETVPSLIPYLDEYVELSDDFNLEDLFIHLSYDIPVLEEIFAGPLGRHELGPFYKAISKSPSKEGEIDYLKLYWIIRLQDHSKNRKGNKYINIHYALDGYGIVDDETGEKGSVSLSFIPLSDIKSCPIKIVTETKVALIKHTRKDPGYSEVFEGELRFTVYEFLSGIFDEITYHGYPDEACVKLAKLDQIIAEVREKEKDDPSFEF